MRRLRRKILLLWKLWDMAFGYFSCNDDFFEVADEDLFDTFLDYADGFRREEER